ncbi:macro domain-containing protein [Ditylenchus destructor]|uniref:Macro domain-containing protein n=1 Tax=Ditylenchus destructor TaxID=166010 RepID=A0AAD4N8X2_9BILA|nr:macro domain-containing protein [Ditylenchus destructor]
MASDLIKKKLHVMKGDITKVQVDAIVNAANSSLLGGGGVDGAIHNAAGDELYEECKTLGGCETGGAKITNAYDIKTTKRIIHVVGPCVYGGLNDIHRQKLADCYRNAFELAKNQKLRSIAFPCISTGIYSFPNVEAARIALNTTTEWLNEKENDEMIEKVIFCCFLEKDKKIYEKLLSNEDPGSETNTTSASQSSEATASQASKSSDTGDNKTTETNKPSEGDEDKTADIEHANAEKQPSNDATEQGAKPPTDAKDVNPS